MGEGADYLDETGQDAYFAHLADTCEPDCIYCNWEILWAAKIEEQDDV